MTIRTIVVTGGTRGIGLGLVRALRDRGCKVAFCGRSEGSVSSALDLLGGLVPGELVGFVADVRDLGEVQRLWDQAREALGSVDAWVNNAGLAHDQQPLTRLDPERIRTVVEVNLIGLLHGSRVAIQGFTDQGHGWLFNMEGLGSDYRTRVDGLAVYGSTKAAVRYLSDSLVREVAGTGVAVCTLNPGMVVTDLLLAPYVGRPEELEKSRRILSILSDRVETVTPWLVDRLLAAPPSGTRIQWLSWWRLAGRFLASPFVRRDVLDGVLADSPADDVSTLHR